MKPKSLLSLSLILCCLSAAIHSAFAQGTAFTYQGRLNDGASPANGSYDFVFTIYDLPTGNGGFAVQTNSGMAVSNGLFTAILDLGQPGIFTGPDRWLEVGVRANGATGFTTLSPRQRLTATPYALLAGTISGALPNSSLTGVYTNVVNFNNAGNSFSGSFTGSGGGLTNLNASQLAGAAPATALSNAWKTTGNTGTTPGPNFLGTADNQPLELSVNGGRALRLEPGSPTNGAPNLIGGAPVNFVAPSVFGAVIGGGGATNYFGTIRSNSVLANWGTIGGGSQNTIDIGADHSFIGGGRLNWIQNGADLSSIGGGVFNMIGVGAYESAIGGGNGNSIGTVAIVSTIAGGAGNTIQNGASESAIGGGFLNTIQSAAPYSTIAGGNGNTIQINASYSIVGGGNGNIIQTNASYSAIGGGRSNSIQSFSSYSTIGGGEFNTDGASDGTLCGGRLNFIGAVSTATIGGGDSNTNNGDVSVIGGGLGNVTSGRGSTIPGGVGNVTSGQLSFAAGWQAQALHDGAFVWADSVGGKFSSTAPNQFLIRATGGVGIGTPNPQGGLHVYSTNNPTIVRIQSTGTPGFGRLEFVSNPQGDVNEWRPAFIQSLDAGGFTGGIGFYVNGTGSGNKFSTNEVMRIQNGRVGIGTNAPTTLLQVGSATCNGTTWANASDRNAKENFQPVNELDVLRAVAALPLSRWNYKADKTSEHIGPMAQDFYASFGVGSDDKHISTVDEGGVALAAIQGLNQKVEKQDAAFKARDTEIEALKAKNNALEKRLKALEHLLPRETAQNVSARQTTD
jgi:hypothetical protein